MLTASGSTASGTDQTAFLIDPVSYTHLKADGNTERQVSRSEVQQKTERTQRPAGDGL